MSEQQKNLERVSTRIAGHIKKFFANRVPGNQFRIEELRTYVQDQGEEIAPDSPGRILRDLRQKGVLDYRIVSRKDSLYEVA